MSSVPAGAQTFTQRLQQGGAPGKVTLHQDAAIDELVNGKPATPKQPAATTGSKPKASTGGNGQQTRLKTETAQQQDTTSTVERRTRQVMGWRIQAYVGGKTRADRQRAEQAGSALRSLFPGQRVYVHFLSPRWICRMGNFRTQAEAREVLDEVVRMGYDTATIVRDKITVTD